jgi:eukaryotic-like serine/threonine-protein kinase
MEETDLTMARAQARVGTLLNGKWRLDKLIGVGGMAAVYAATHRNAKRVAIKILHPEISVDDNARQRFLREGYAANQVGHRGAVSADDDGITEDGVAFLVMELLDGETIEERSVRLGGTLKPREVLALMNQALATLEAAHEKGIVHRDLKPENLFLTHEGVVKVLDFGIARMADQAAKSPSQTQGIMGTPSFMAPEQARGRWEEVDQRTDLWAIGATMFTLFSGRFVHRAETANEALVAAVTQRAPSLATVVANAHPAVIALVDKALTYERELRFQNATEFRAALQAADAAIAGDEASPSLRIPKTNAPQVTQSGELGLTTEGVAASVRGAQTNPTVLATQRAKAPIALASVAVAALLVLVGRGLFAGAGKPSAFAAEAPASAAPTVSAPAARTDTPVSTAAAASAPSIDPSAIRAAPATEIESAQPAPKATSKAAHSAAAHTPAAASLAAASAKAHAAKSTADLLKKRH